MSQRRYSQDIRLKVVLCVIPAYKRPAMLKLRLIGVRDYCVLEASSASGGFDRLSCCRFDGHRVWVFHEAGGGPCRDEDLVEFKVEAVKLVRERGVSAAQAGRDLGVHENVLRKWVKEFGSDPVQAFPGQGQMKPSNWSSNACGARSTS